MHFTFLKVSWSSLNYLLWASRNLQKNRDGVFWEKSISSEFEAENNRRIWFKLLEIDFSEISFREIFWKLVERCKSIYCESRATYRKIIGGDCVVEVIFDEWPIISLFEYQCKKNAVSPKPNHFFEKCFCQPIEKCPNPTMDHRLLSELHLYMRYFCPKGSTKWNSMNDLLFSSR